MAEEFQAGTTLEAGVERHSLPTKPSGPCWICGGTRQHRVWKSEFDLTSLPRFGPALAHSEHPPIYMVRCRDCGFGQPEVMPDMPDYFETLYAIPFSEASLDKQFNDPYKDWVFTSLAAELGRRLAADLPRTLLDVGCHHGRFLHVAKQAGWQAEGAELAERTAEFAASRTGATIHRGPAQTLIERGLHFGAVTITDVLEHIPQPAPLVRQLRELLLPGGILAVKVPHGRMQRIKEKIRGDLLRRPDAGIMTRLVHVNHFSVASLRRVLEDAGFEDVTVTVAVPEMFYPDPKTRTFTQGLGMHLREAFYYAAKLLPGGVHTPLALNLQAFARNPR